MQKDKENKFWIAILRDIQKANPIALHFEF